MTKQNSFSREFKLEAVRLLELGERNAADLARDLKGPGSGVAHLKRYVLGKIKWARLD